MPDDPLVVFSANLKRERQLQGLSQERLAERAGMNLVHVSRIERSEREPGVRSVVKLAKGLGVPVGQLFEDV